MLYPISSDLNLVVPELRLKVNAMIKEASNQGLNVRPFEALRSLDRQKCLYGQGRTGWECLKAGISASWARPGNIVTWTLQSQHLVGKAVDMVFVTPEGNTTWSGDWNKLIAIGNSVGLTNLAPRELSHFQIA